MKIIERVILFNLKIDIDKVMKLRANIEDSKKTQTQVAHSLPALSEKTQKGDNGIYKCVNCRG